MLRKVLLSESGQSMAEGRKEGQEMLRKILGSESGQSMAEYALIAALIAVVAMVALGNIGTNVKDKFDKIATELGK